MGHYDHRPPSFMDREDFAILTTTMDGIVTAMNVMSDQINNHTDMVVKELKEQREKNTKFMQKVDAKLLQMKKDLQKILKEKEDKKEDNQEESTKQTDIIVKEQRQIYGLIVGKFKAQKEKIEETERNDDSFKHNLMSQMKEQNEKIVSLQNYLFRTDVRVSL
ncbi:uncharacterized protein LOC144620056 [Crassostrea virginica]